MDNAILTAVVEELRGLAIGSPLGDIVQIDSRSFALRFSVPPYLRILVSLHPGTSSMGLQRRISSPREPTELASVLTREAGGRELVSLRKQKLERVVEMEFASAGMPARVLVLELMGKASNLLLLDEERRILRFLTTHRGAFRRPETGRLYEPPPPRETRDDAPLGSPMLARELAARVASGEPEVSVRAALEERVQAGPWEAVLYTPHPPGAIAESENLPAARCFASPFPLESAAGLEATPCAGPGAAAGAHLALVRRHLIFRDRHAALVSRLGAELSKAGRLQDTLAREAEAAEGAGEIRRKGELIMASLSSAEKRGAEVELTDYFLPEMPRIRIPIDPSLDLHENAEAFFRRARKLDRAVGVIARRRREVDLRCERARTALAEVERASSMEALEKIEAGLHQPGATRRVRLPEKAAPGRRPALMKLKEFRTRDGHTVLVGASASDNDALTFKVAAPHDFWLHAAGRTGAHVIVRNPSRKKELPEGTLLEAAAIAAWFSRGDRDGEVDVHVTRRKEVRKGKGMPAGMVSLRKHRTLRVRPAPPASGQEEGA